MPEEFFFLLLELGLGVGCGLVPATLNRPGLLTIGVSSLLMPVL
jgi:hypothetical protein